MEASEWYQPNIYAYPTRLPNITPQFSRLDPQSPENHPKALPAHPRLPNIHIQRRIQTGNHSIDHKKAGHHQINKEVFCTRKSEQLK